MPLSPEVADGEPVAPGPAGGSDRELVGEAEERYPRRRLASQEGTLLEVSQAGIQMNRSGIRLPASALVGDVLGLLWLLLLAVIALELVVDVPVVVVALALCAPRPPPPGLHS